MRRLAGLVVILGAAAAWWLWPRGTTPAVEAYALQYGRSKFRGDYLMQGLTPAPIDFAWLVFPFRTAEGWGLVDTGFSDPAMAERFKLTEFTPPARLLERLGVRPEEITDLILTHGHWDHAGDLAAFPRARVWMSQAELEDMRLRLSDESWVDGYRREDLEQLDKVEAAGRLRLIKGTTTVRPGVEVVVMGGHTAGCLAVRLGKTVLATDNAYLFRNLSERRPIGKAARLGGEDALSRLLEMGPSLIPGHDPELIRRFPSVAEDVVKLP